MTGQERANKLLGAIDDLIAGHNLNRLDDEDLEELLQTAEARLDATRSAARLGAQYEGAVWRQVQASIQGRSRRVSLLSRLRCPHREAKVLASAVDRLILGEPFQEASDPWLEELIRLARARMAMARATTAASRHLQERLWARLRPRLLSQLVGGHQSSRGLVQHGHPWSKLAAAGAAIALLLAALGPVPATGLANHPIAQFVRFVGNHVGVSETNAPPIVSHTTDIVQGRDVSAAQAAELLGLPVREPRFILSGFRQVSSRYFPRPLTASEGGVFLLAYAAEITEKTATPPTILIYQEHASGDDIVVLKGSTLDLTLSDGTPATYVQGAWQASSSQIVWGEDGVQTLVFDRAGLRTIIQYRGGAPWSPDELGSIAEGMIVVANP